MGAEDAPVGVALVDHDEAQGAQEGGPAGVGRQDSAVQHVGVGQDVVRVLAHPFAFLDRGVAVVDRGAYGVAERGRQFLHRAPLVGGEGLGGGEVQGGRAAAVGGLGAVQQGAEDRGEVGERLAGGGTGGDHDRFAVQGVLGGGAWWAHGWSIPASSIAAITSGRMRSGQMAWRSRSRGQVLRMSDARGPARPCGEPVEDHGGRGAVSPLSGGRPGR